MERAREQDPAFRVEGRDLAGRAHQAAMVFRQISFGSDEYKLECMLREEVLRRPLGLSLGPEDLAGEKDQLHFGLFDPRKDLVGCVIAAPLSPAQAKIRQMAVSPSRQGKGLGRIIMGELENDLRARGFKNLVLDARASAVGFYGRMGYSVVGEEFTEVTIAHFRMEKNLLAGCCED